MTIRVIALLVGILGVLAAAVAVLVVRVTGPNPAALPGGELVEFRAEEAGFAISHPADWRRIESPDEQVRLVATPNDRDSVLVRVVGLTTPVEEGQLTAVRDFTRGLVTDGTGIELTAGPEQVELAGLPGWYYLYRFTDEATGRQGVHSHYFLFRGDRMFVLVFQALPQGRFQQLAPVFDRIAESFRRLDG